MHPYMTSASQLVGHNRSRIHVFRYTAITLFPAIIGLHAGNNKDTVRIIAIMCSSVIVDETGVSIHKVIPCRNRDQSCTCTCNCNRRLMIYPYIRSLVGVAIVIGVVIVFAIAIVD